LTSSELRVPVLALLLALLAPALVLAQEPPPEARGRMERRLRMARSLGLAEALDLDEAGTARLNALMAPFDARRKALLDTVRGDVRTLRQAARRGDPKALAEVEGAVQRVFDARGAVLSIDREMFAALSKGMPPEQVARMALFFAQFRQRFGMELPEPPGGGSR
jgi:Spy/CpxP family protein refolding chaperone